jgi:biotin carboxyl carrier protein
MARYHVTIDQREYDVTVEYHSEKYRVEIDGQVVTVDRKTLWGNRALLLVDNESLEIDISYESDRNERVVFMHGHDIPVRVEDYNLGQLRKTAGMAAQGAAETTLRAPMPGLVVGLKVSVGDPIVKDQPLLVIEAMKMENVLRAKADAVVKEIPVTTGQSVDKGERLMEFE